MTDNVLILLVKQCAPVLAATLVCAVKQVRACFTIRSDHDIHTELCVKLKLEVYHSFYSVVCNFLSKLY